MASEKSNITLENQVDNLTIQSNDDSSNKESISLTYARYESELQMPDIVELITKDLSEPYSIYTYRYFLHNWPRLAYLVRTCDKDMRASTNDT